MYELIFNMMTFLLLLGVSIPTIYMGYRVKVTSLRTLMILLSMFLLVHGAYHFLDTFEALFATSAFETFNEFIVGPLNLTILLAFSIYFMKRWS